MSGKALVAQDTPIPDLKVITRSVSVDERGSFGRLFCVDQLLEAGWCWPVAQVNRSTTKKAGTIRGLHFQQPPFSEAKLVICISGAIWDVALDLRKNSPTFLSWHAEHLSEENARGLLIPPGFAHGFQTLTNNVEMLYVHSQPYHPEAEDGFNVLSPGVAITWPRRISRMSPRDRLLPIVSERFLGLEV